MLRALHLTLILLFCLIAGCGGRTSGKIVDRVTILVPGVFGDGPGYNGVYDELAKSAGPVEIFPWGAPKPLFALNFSNQGIHADAEKKLAKHLDELPAGVKRITLIGHSAGGGVALGAAAKTSRRIRQIILLSPNTSPTYDLRPALQKTDKTIDVFYSHLDTTFLKWRTSNFGTYDDLKVEAAGFKGFDLSNLDSRDKPRVQQHPYQASWQDLGNHGGHNGVVAPAFFKTVVLPRLAD